MSAAHLHLLRAEPSRQRAYFAEVAQPAVEPFSESIL